jgi:ABC-type uncharacterized transport system involved in gliding motility auxiliary subunit
VTERQQFEIDQYIMAGGRAIFLVDAIAMPSGMLQATPLDTGLGPMLAHYGVKLGNNLILDNSREFAGFQQQRGAFYTAYYYWPKLTKNSFSRDNPATNQLNAGLFPWTQSLEAVQDPEDGFEVAALVTSSQQAWETKGYYNLSPSQNFPVRQEDLKTFNFCLASTGRFSSFFKGKEIPKAEGESAPDLERQTVEESPMTRIVVIGNSNFIADQPFLRQKPQNAVLFHNLVDWLTLSQDLIGIRAKTQIERPLEVSPSGTITAEVLNFAGVPLLVVIFGLVRYMVKKRSRKILESMKL